VHPSGFRRKVRWLGWPNVPPSCALARSRCGRKLSSCGAGPLRIGVASKKGGRRPPFSVGTGALRASPGRKGNSFVTTSSPPNRIDHVFGLVFCRPEDDLPFGVPELVEITATTFWNCVNNVRGSRHSPSWAKAISPATWARPKAAYCIISSGGGGPHRFADDGSFGQTFGTCGLSRCQGRGSK
jgi:hypothetical protein